MELFFEISKRKRFWCVNVWVRIISNPYQRCYLEERQYNVIDQWCKTTFSNTDTKNRVRRMSYADFWFLNKKDLDWFLMRWSGVDIDSI
jgi:hypothetical protein